MAGRVRTWVVATMLLVGAVSTVVGGASPVQAQDEDVLFDWGGETKAGTTSGKQTVRITAPGARPGDIIVSFGDRRLYFITAPGVADSYPIAIPREQSRWEGVTSVSQKRENPSWTPTPTMLAENPKLPRWVPGGHPMNPLGNRALYLGTSAYRIHGTDAPWTIGTAASKGCVRLFNDDVADLYPRVKVGARVTVTWNRYDGSVKPIATAPVATAPPTAASRPRDIPVAARSRAEAVDATVDSDEPPRPRRGLAGRDRDLTDEAVAAERAARRPARETRPTATRDDGSRDDADTPRRTSARGERDDAREMAPRDGTARASEELPRKPVRTARRTAEPTEETDGERREPVTSAAATPEPTPSKAAVATAGADDSRATPPRRERKPRVRADGKPPRQTIETGAVRSTAEAGAPDEAQSPAAIAARAEAAAQRAVEAAERAAAAAERAAGIARQ
jgi:lipoprotein-anchoring transpeptidase ErfK/SrfK